MRLSLRMACCMVGLLTMAFSQSVNNNKQQRVPSMTNDSIGPRRSSNPVVPGDSPLEDLKKALQEQLEARSYRLNRIFSTSAGSSQVFVEWLAPDKLRETAEEGQIKERRLIGSLIYAKSSEGVWHKAQAPQGWPEGRPSIKPLIRDAKGANYIGKEVFNGIPMLVYEVTYPRSTNVVPTKIWIGEDDGLPHKLERKSSAPMVIYTEVYSDYDAYFSIEPPIE